MDHKIDPLDWYAVTKYSDISQGDIISDMPFINTSIDPLGNAEITGTSKAHAMILTYDCQMDKPDASYALVAKIIPLSNLDAGRRGHVRSNRFSAFFYLPASDRIDESFVDLRQTERYSVLAIRVTREKTLLHCLTEARRDHLRLCIARFFGMRNIKADYTPPAAPEG